jgi:hypothetical protein
MTGTTAYASRTAQSSTSNTSSSTNTSSTQPQQQAQQEELPNLLQLVSLYGARLTTAAQMVWDQVSWQAALAPTWRLQAQLASHRTSERHPHSQHMLYLRATRMHSLQATTASDIRSCLDKCPQYKADA